MVLSNRGGPPNRHGWLQMKIFIVVASLSFVLGFIAAYNIVHKDILVVEDYLSLAPRSWDDGKKSIIPAAFAPATAGSNQAKEVKAKTPPVSVCRFRAAVSAKTVSSRVGRTFRPTLEVDGGDCEMSFSGGALVETTFYAQGALVSRQTSHLCDSTCEEEGHSTTTDEGPRPCSTVPFLNVSQRVCPLVYVPVKKTPTTMLPPAAAATTPQNEQLYQDRFQEVSKLCGDSFDSPQWSGPMQFGLTEWTNLYAAMVHAFTTLPQPFLVLESGNFCGSSTCYIAATKRLYCPECPFLSVDPGNMRRKRVEKNGNPIDPQCVEKNMDLVGLTKEVTVLDNTTGQEGPISQPIGFIFNDDGKYHEIVSVQHPLWEPYIMDGAIIAYHDYWQDYKGDPDLGSDDAMVMKLKPKNEKRKAHRTWIADLLNTQNYEPFYLPRFISEFKERPKKDSWMQDIGVVKKKVATLNGDASPSYVVEVTVKESVHAGR